MRISTDRQIIGTIERRLLLSYRADPDVVRPLVPESLRLRLVDGQAVVGICLLALDHLRERHLPVWAGLRSSNVAHRIAVDHPTDHGWQPSVYIPIRHSSSRMNVLVGGRAWPGVHRAAHIRSEDDGEHVAVHVAGPGLQIDVVGHRHQRLTSRLFATIDEASEFYRCSAIGWSPDHHGRLEGMQLDIAGWQVDPFALETVHSSYFEDRTRFPSGTIALDSALVMRDAPVSCRRERVSSEHGTLSPRPCGILP